jgi:hypothetical protein
MKILNNIKNSIITTIFGILFLLGSLTYMLWPIFTPDFVVDNLSLIIGASVGVGLLISPDDLFKKLKDKL